MRKKAFFILTVILVAILCATYFYSHNTITTEDQAIYNNVQLSGLDIFLKTLVASQYQYHEGLIINEVVVVDNGNQMRYTTSGWEQDGVRLFARAYYSIKGQKFTKDNQLISYEVIGSDQSVKNAEGALLIAKEVFGEKLFSNNRQQFQLKTEEQVVEYSTQDEMSTNIGGIMQKWNFEDTNWIFFVCSLYKYEKMTAATSCFDDYKK